MKKICLFSCLFFSQYLLACCGYVNPNIFSILQQKEGRFSVFTIQIDSNFMLPDRFWGAKATVLERYSSSTPIPNQVEIFSGGDNTAGGEWLEIGKIYFVAGYEFEKGKFTAFSCDGHSRKLSGNPDSSMIVTKMLNYKNHTAQKYTGKVKYYNDTVLIAEGNLRKGLPHGTWKYYNWEGNLLSAIDYKNGEKTGTEIIYENVNAPFKNVVVKNKKRQIYTRYNEYGKVILKTIEKFDKKGNSTTSVEIFDKNSKITQKYTTFQMSQVHLSPSYIDDFEQYGTNGKIINKGKYENGAKIGQWLEQNSKDSTLETKFYPMIKKTKGIFVWYYATGIKSVEGRRNKQGKQGVWIFYNEKGDTSSIETYKNNKKNGVSKYYNEKNQLISKKTYVDDIENGQLINFYPENGQIESECHYQSGKIVGLYKSYYANGNIKTLSNYNKNGEEHGNTTIYNKNGTIYSNVEYINGQIHGRIISFDEDGTIIKQGEFDHGIKVGEWLTYYQNGKIRERCIYAEVRKTPYDKECECEYFEE